MQPHADSMVQGASDCIATMFEHHCKIGLLATIIRKQESRKKFSQPDLVVILQSQPHTNRHAPRQDYGLTRKTLTIY